MITISKFKDEDVRATEELRLATWKVAYKGIVDQEYLDYIHVKEEKLEGLKTFANNEKTIFFIAKDEDKIVGFISGKDMLNDDKDFEADLSGIYILPDYHGQGIGKKLVKPFLEALIKRGINNSSIVVFSENASSIGFYKKLGAEYIKTIDVEIPSGGGRFYKADVMAFKDVKACLKLLA
jgi:ribosomal protein S18 acetylase RimI-like enzyme